MKHLPALILALSFLTGCATKHYSAYSGNQVWLVSKGATVETSHAIPVYYGWPERPYRVIGCIHSDEVYASWNTRDTSQAARLARNKGGDAMILRCNAETDSVAPPSSAPGRVPFEHIHALVIKWKSQSEVEEASHRLDGLRAYLRRSFPTLRIESKPELWALGLEYVAWLGLDINSQQGAAKLEELLTNFIPTANNSTLNQWLFKATISVRFCGPLPIEETAYGIAALTQTGEKISIVARPGKVNLNFDGHLAGTNVRGGMKFVSRSHTFTRELDGSMFPGKIQLPATNLSQTVRSGFVFVR